MYSFKVSSGIDGFANDGPGVAGAMIADSFGCAGDEEVVLEQSLHL